MSNQLVKKNQEPASGSSSAGSETAPKTSGNALMMLIVGGVCSSFVGMLYGYSFLKHEIAEEMGMDPNDMGAPGDLGFAGQYAAFIPGLVFDFFGPSITILYGSILAAAGFILAGTAIKINTFSLLMVALPLAGQGSKALGFGSMLGTVNMWSDAYTGAIAGAYLCLDSLSSVMLIAVYGAFDDENGGKSYPKAMMGSAPADFLFWTGCVVGVVGLVSCVLYFFFYKPLSAENEEEEQEQLELVQSQHGDNRMSSNSVMSRRGRAMSTCSVAAEAKIAGSAAAEGTLQSYSQAAIKQAEEDVKSVKEHQEEEKKTWWVGVIAVFIVCIFAESQGLAFNGAASSGFSNARKYQNGLVNVDLLKEKTTSISDVTGKKEEKVEGFPISFLNHDLDVSSFDHAVFEQYKEHVAAKTEKIGDMKKWKIVLEKGEKEGETYKVVLKNPKKDAKPEDHKELEVPTKFEHGKPIEWSKQWSKDAKLVLKKGMGLTMGGDVSLLNEEKHVLHKKGEDKVYYCNDKYKIDSKLKAWFKGQKEDVAVDKNTGAKKFYSVCHHAHKGTEDNDKPVFEKKNEDNKKVSMDKHKDICIHRPATSDEKKQEVELYFRVSTTEKKEGEEAKTTQEYVRAHSDCKPFDAKDEDKDKNVVKGKGMLQIVKQILTVEEFFKSDKICKETHGDHCSQTLPPKSAPVAPELFEGEKKEEGKIAKATKHYQEDAQNKKSFYNFTDVTRVQLDHNQNVRVCEGTFIDVEHEKTKVGANLSEEEAKKAKDAHVEDVFNTRCIGKPILAKQSEEDKKAGKVNSAEHSVFDHALSKKTHVSTAPLVITFAVANGVGRLSFGVLSDKTAGSSSGNFNKAFYFLVGQLLYIIGFLTVRFVGPTSLNSLWPLVALVGIGYGGIFTIITSVMKKYCAKNLVGVVLGCALVCIAIGSYCSGQYSHGSSEVAGEHLGPNTQNTFFLVALICQLPIVAVSGFLWKVGKTEEMEKAAENDSITEEESSDEE